MFLICWLNDRKIKKLVWYTLWPIFHIFLADQFFIYFLLMQKRIIRNMFQQFLNGNAIFNWLASNLTRASWLNRSHFSRSHNIILIVDRKINCLLNCLEVVELSNKFSFSITICLHDIWSLRLDYLQILSKLVVSWQW